MEVRAEEVFPGRKSYENSHGPQIALVKWLTRQREKFQVCGEQVSYDLGGGGFLCFDACGVLLLFFCQCLWTLIKSSLLKLFSFKKVYFNK